MSSKSAPQPIGKATRLRKLKLSPYEETEKPRRVAIYVRVSKEEQAEGQSLAEQERRCRRGRDVGMRVQPQVDLLTHGGIPQGRHRLLVDRLTEHAIAIDLRPGARRLALTQASLAQRVCRRSGPMLRCRR